jgi:hypothetical protein
MPADPLSRAKAGPNTANVLAEVVEIEVLLERARRELSAS